MSFFIRLYLKLSIKKSPENSLMDTAVDQNHYDSARRNKTPHSEHHLSSLSTETKPLDDIKQSSRYGRFVSPWIKMLMQCMWIQDGYYGQTAFIKGCTVVKIGGTLSWMSNKSIPMECYRVRRSGKTCWAAWTIPVLYCQ